jgi:putative nucleotidyltransferase with HDIG domain
VARSQAALSQILAVKQYENLTYCHSVNVAMLSLLLGRQLHLGDDSMSALVEAALLHDIGKTRIPLDIVRKPGALTKRERKLIETHTTFGAEILAQTEGLGELTPIVALEHHRSVKGSGYPDLGNAVPHIMSQIVSVADIYEAITGARSYQDPTMPDRACLVLARLAGEKLNTVFVKAFVNAITFFPLGRQDQPRRDRRRHSHQCRRSPSPRPRSRGPGPGAPAGPHRHAHARRVRLVRASHRRNREAARRV